MIAFLPLLLLAAVAAAGGAEAHSTDLAAAEVRVEGEVVRYELTVSAHDLAVALGIETDLVTPVPAASFEARREALADYLRRGLKVAADGGPCAPQPPAVDYSRLPDDVVLDIVFRCAGPVRRLAISYGLFYEIDPRHVSIGRVATPAGEEEFLFDRTLSEFELELAEPAPGAIERFRRLVWLGVEHILFGYDHILFLVALLIGNPRFWNLVKVVSAFTLAHSLTLALAWYGIVELPARLTESLIALTIAYVAAENLWRRRPVERWPLAFGLGLVHGLGFYSALAGIELAREHALTTLLAFNLGVELGQLAIMAAFFVLLFRLIGSAWYGQAVRFASAAILAVAVYWAALRAFVA